MKRRGFRLRARRFTTPGGLRFGGFIRRGENLEKTVLFADRLGGGGRARLHWPPGRNPGARVASRSRPQRQARRQRQRHARHHRNSACAGPPAQAFPFDSLAGHLGVCGWTRKGGKKIFAPEGAQRGDFDPRDGPGGLLPASKANPIPPRSGATTLFFRPSVSSGSIGFGAIWGVLFGLRGGEGEGTLHGLRARGGLRQGGENRTSAPFRRLSAQAPAPRPIRAAPISHYLKR